MSLVFLRKKKRSLIPIFLSGMDYSATESFAYKDLELKITRFYGTAKAELPFSALVLPSFNFLACGFLNPK